MSSLAVMTPLECVQVRLAAAVLCQDCETISNTPHAYCPACGSQSLLLLARVLNRTEGNPLRQLPGVFEPPKGMCEEVTDCE